MATISFVIATVGRESIQKTLASIETWDGDEIVIAGAGLPPSVRDDRVRHLACEPGHDWGHRERNFVAGKLRGDYVAHIDDDDAYVAGARELMASAIAEAPDRPSLFRMRYPSGVTLWSARVLVLGNVGTPMMLLPNQPEKFGTWGPFNGGDFHFLQTCGWSEMNWREDVTVLLGHDA